MANRFLSRIEEAPAQTSAPASSNRFLKRIEGIAPEEESIYKKAGRAALQIPLGAAKAHPLSFGADILNAAAEGASMNALSELAEDDPNLNREVAEKARRESPVQIPTQGQIEQLIEEKTGAPLAPKNIADKLLRLGSSAAALRPGGIGERAVAGVTAPAVSAGLEKLGAPEEVSEGVGLLASGLTPGPSLKNVTKPSGMTTRRFEGIEKPTKVTANRANIINETVENDFKNIADQLLEKNRTYSALKDDSLFKEKVSGLFDKVEELAENIPGKIHTEDVRNAFKKRYNSKETKGISPDEFERGFRKEVRSINKSIPYQEMDAKQLVDQFRKNNKSLRELFEPGKSSAFNRAKKEALLEYNRAIEDVITKQYPDTEFKDLFEFTNKRWQEISDIEQIDKFMGDVFKGKVNYGEAKKIFRRDKEHLARPFKRILGDKGFEDFKVLTEDLLSSEKGMSHIKKAREAGYSDLAKTAAAYTINPKVGLVHSLSKYGKMAYQMLLDKPKLTITWKNALDNLKTGNFKEAEKGFNQLDKEVTQSSQTSHLDQQKS